MDSAQVERSRAFNVEAFYPSVIAENGQSLRAALATEHHAQTL